MKKDYREAIESAKFSYNKKYIHNSRNKCKGAWKVINNNHISGGKIKKSYMFSSVLTF